MAYDKNRVVRNRSIGINDAEVAELVARLHQLPGYLGRDIQKLLKYASEPTLELAKQLAPDTKDEKTIAWQGGKANDGGGLRWVSAGDLKKNIKHLSFPRMRRNVIIGVRLRSKAKSGMVGRFAYRVEFGGRGRVARPFMRPAFDATKTQVVARLKFALAGKIKPWATKYNRKRKR